MPNWKYPCVKCSKPVKTNQKGIECNICMKWIHLKCTKLSIAQYDYLEGNNDTPFLCYICNPEWVCFIPDNPNHGFATPPTLPTHHETSSTLLIPDTVTNPINPISPTDPPSLPNHLDPTNLNTPLDSSSSADVILNYTDNIDNPNDSTLSFDCSSANTSDFVYVDESDSDYESRGLNFKSLPTRL